MKEHVSEYLILLGIVCKPKNVLTGGKRGLNWMERGLFTDVNKNSMKMTNISNIGNKVQ